MFFHSLNNFCSLTFFKIKFLFSPKSTKNRSAPFYVVYNTTMNDFSSRWLVPFFYLIWLEYWILCGGGKTICVLSFPFGIYFYFFHRTINVIYSSIIHQEQYVRLLLKVDRYRIDIEIWNSSIPTLLVKQSFVWNNAIPPNTANKQYFGATSLDHLWSYLHPDQCKVSNFVHDIESLEVDSKLNGSLNWLTFLLEFFK